MILLRVESFLQSLFSINLAALENTIMLTTKFGILSLESNPRPTLAEETEKLLTPSESNVDTESDGDAKAFYAKQDKAAVLSLMDILSSTKPTPSTTSEPAKTSCTRSKLYRHVTVVGGLQAGNFTRLVEFTDMDDCAQRCCAERSCDVAILMRNTCFGLQCSSPELCSARPSQLRNFSMKMIYMYREKSKGMFWFVDILNCFPS